MVPKAFIKSEHFFCLTSRNSNIKLSIKLSFALLLRENMQLVKYNPLVQDRVGTDFVSRFIRFIIY